MAVAVESEQTILNFQHLNFDVIPGIQIPETREIISERETARLLTEVDHLVESLEANGYVPEAVKADVTTNLETALAETSMPYAVTRTAHKVETVWDAETERSQRTFQWLGRCAVGVAQSGYEFHFSEAAKKRVDVEVAEAAHAQETLTPGKVQFFLSPRMTDVDAPTHIAKQEHLHHEDSIRASYLVTDSEGNETYRVMESLLVSDVPLPAWVAMLRDEHNIFEKSITVENEASALSVMQTFEALELPAGAAPEGPVTLVEAVLPYIEDRAVQLSVQLQLDKFREDQAVYQQQAKLHATEWYDFDLELAKSVQKGISTPAIEQFITDMEPLWSEDIRTRIEDHAVEGGLLMTRELAALTEKAKRNIIATKAAVRTGNEKVIEQVDAHTVAAIQNYMPTSAYGPIQENVYSRELERSIVQQDVKVSGGCAGGSCGLEGVAEGTKESVELRKKLNASDSDTIVKDKERACRCGKKSIVYAYNKNKVTKLCESCGAFESKVSKA